MSNPSGADLYGIDPQEWGDAIEEGMLAGGADPADAVLAGIQARHDITQPLPQRFALQRLDREGRGEGTERVRMDELRAGDRIVQPAVDVGDGCDPVAATYQVTGAVGSNPRYPRFLWVEQLDPPPAEVGRDPSGFFAYDPATLMHRLRRGPGR